MSSSMLGITLDHVLRDCIDGMFVIDAGRKVVLFSEGCERITGFQESAVCGAACLCHELTNCRDEHGRALSGILCPAVKILAGEIESYRQRMTIARADGRRVWVETTYSPVKDDGGSVSGIVGVMRDITDVKLREDDVLAASMAESEGEGLGMRGDDGGPVETADPHSLGTLDRKLTALEKQEIVEALAHADGQRTQAARSLGISRSRLYRRMEALGIAPRGVVWPGSHSAS